jgi:thioredoxin-related protein
MSRWNGGVRAGLAVVLVCLFTLAGTAGDEASLWQTNFEDAKTKAKADNKLLLVDFTGSDWCGWCIKLKQEVFDQEAFLKEAPQRFVLVELDFPRTKQLPEELKTQNDQLAQQFQVSGFPTILVLDADGQLIARTGYRPGGPEEYLKHLAEFVTAHETIVRMRTELAGVQGLDRAKLLDQLIEAYAKLENEHSDIKTWSEEIVALDAENKAGLKVKYQFRQLLAEAEGLKRNRKFDEAKAAYDKALALPGISGELKQDAYFDQGECFFNSRDFVAVVACLKQAVEAAPDSSKAANIQTMLQRFAPMAEGQEAVAKIKTELEAAQGVDRAKLLDQLLDARTKLSQSMPDPDLAQDTEKWSQEIVTLDAENKAGLKSKYEVRVLLTEAQNQLREQKFDQAHAALDKALALPGLAGEPLQEVLLVKATCHASNQEFQKTLDCCQKALEAAPESSHARMIQSLMQRAQAELDRQKAKEQPKTEEAKPEEPKTETPKPPAAN